MTVEVKVEEILDHVDREGRLALQQALSRYSSVSEIDIRTLYREFVRAMGRRCSTWERVPDHYVRGEGRG